MSSITILAAGNAESGLEGGLEGDPDVLVRLLLKDGEHIHVLNTALVPVVLPRPTRPPTLFSFLTALCLLLQLPYVSASPARTIAERNPLAGLHARAMDAGTSCSGSEGQWNCMTNSWQRCAAGQWSVVMQCAKGTHCLPSGLTNDFKVQADQDGTSSSTASGSLLYGTTSPARVFCIALLTVSAMALAF